MINQSEYTPALAHRIMLPYDADGTKKMSMIACELENLIDMPYIISSPLNAAYLYSVLSRIIDERHRPLIDDSHTEEQLFS